MHETPNKRPVFTGAARALGPLVRPVSNRIARLPLDFLRTPLKRELAAAGEPGGSAADDFLALTALLTSAVAAAMLPLASRWTVAALAFPAAVLPVSMLLLHKRAAARRFAILKRLAYAVDLLTLCVEAGLDFPSALARLIKHEQPGPLREEFSETLHQIRMGLPRREAMRNLRDRISLPALSRVVTAFIQADTLGTGISAALRIQADEVRRCRFQRAEKKAMEAPVRMLLPLVGFIFPAVFVILLGPILLAMMHSGILGGW